MNKEQEDFFESKRPIELPFIGEDFVVKKMSCLCMDCGTTIESFRGEIWKSFSVVEYDIAGKCPICSSIKRIRARFNLKTGRSYRFDEGDWKENIKESLSKKFWENTFNNDLYGGSGFCVGMLLSFYCGQIIKIKEFAFILLVTMLFCMILGYFEARRK